MSENVSPGLDFAPELPVITPEKDEEFWHRMETKICHNVNMTRKQETHISFLDRHQVSRRASPTYPLDPNLIIFSFMYPQIDRFEALVQGHQP
jgi:hypothetical protein